MAGETIPLTRMAHGSGCGCKLGPGLLTQALAAMPGLPADPNILVGHDRMDDAAVYRLDADTAIAATVDFFTPVVDDPATFGAIAATNALSDIYAMGGRPTFALAVTAFPKDGDLAVLGERHDLRTGEAAHERMLGLDAAVEDALTQVGLWKDLKDRLHTVATGLQLEQQQKLCIARLIPLKPEVILMDEPCSALDVEGTRAIEELMFGLKERFTIVIVTHELPSIFLVAHNCIVLDKAAKGIVARGDPRRLRDESAIPFVHNFFTRSSPGAAATEKR